MTVPAFGRDGLVIPLMRKLRRCAAEQFALAGRMPCRFPLTWNENLPPADACDCFCELGQGQAWVRWVETKPADLGRGKASECVHGTFEITLELGVYRCWPVPDKGPLNEGEEELAALAMLLDAAVLRRSPLCCDAFDELTWELVKEEPIAHSGGCTGVKTELTVMGTDCACGSFSQVDPAVRQGVTQLATRREAT